MKDRREAHFFQHPFLVFAGLLFFQIISLTLLFWSLGDEALPERVMDLIFLISLPVLVLFIQSLLFVAVEKKYISLDFQIHDIIKIAGFSFIVFHLFFNGLNIDRSDGAKKAATYISILHTKSNIGNAYLEILNGNAQAFNKEQYEMYELVKSCSEEICTLPRLSLIHI